MLLLVTLLSGCMPIVVPPAHVRLGAGRTTSDIKREDREGVVKNTDEIPHFAVGLDSTTFAELPFVVETGLVTDFVNGGMYLEGGYLRRIHPKFRVGATAGTEYWFGENNGAGVRTGVTLEYVRPFRQRTGSETTGSSHDDLTTTHIAESGTPGVGMFVDAGYRSLELEKYGYVVFGLSIRLPAMAGIADFTAQH